MEIAELQRGEAAELKQREATEVQTALLATEAPVVTKMLLTALVAAAAALLAQSRVTLVEAVEQVHRPLTAPLLQPLALPLLLQQPQPKLLLLKTWRQQQQLQQLQQLQEQ